jgi:hypothetical protein
VAEISGENERQLAIPAIFTKGWQENVAAYGHFTSSESQYALARVNIRQDEARRIV